MNILALSGFAPEAILDVVRFTHFNGERNIPHFCGYVSDFISQGLNDEKIDGLIFPRSCDSSRNIGSYLDEINKFVFQINVPQRFDEAGRAYYKEELKRFIAAVKEYYHKEVNLEDITERVKLINKRNAEIREVYEKLHKYRYSDYLKEIHNNLVKPLSKQHFNKENIKTFDTSDKKKVFLMGSFMSEPELAKLAEDAGLAVVADDLPESGRMVESKDIPIEGDILENIANYYVKALKSPSQNDFKSIVEYDFKKIRDKQALGIIMVVQKYCEPYEFLYSVFKKKSEEAGIPIIKINIADSKDINKAKLQLEAFRGIL